MRSDQCRDESNDCSKVSITNCHQHNFLQDCHTHNKAPIARKGEHNLPRLRRSQQDRGHGARNTSTRPLQSTTARRPGAMAGDAWKAAPTRCSLTSSGEILPSPFSSRKAYTFPS
mmetsp:Transcript_117873/g.165694  ORF Transcript_117873/g.165694 Transcript_117873/m.165694 type:complete len:115 (-) Transcript_117873:27-371(-)